MKILGIDPALLVTGYGAINSQNGKLDVIEAGVIKTSSSQPITQRLDYIHRQVAALLTDTKPDVVVLEKLYAHYRHPTTSYLLGQARGVICLACAQMKIPLVEYAATRVKKAIVGKGLASKQQVQKMVVCLMRIEKLPKYTDTSDALALAIAHSYIARSKDNLR